MTKQTIAEFVTVNPNASAKEVAEACNVSVSTAYKYMKEIAAEADAAYVAEMYTEPKAAASETAEVAEAVVPVKEVAVADNEAAENHMVATPDGKSYTTKTQKGYSKAQMNFVYSHCKNHDLYIAKNVLEMMYGYADKFNFVEEDPVKEDLRNCACKLVKCVSLGKYDMAQTKGRYIQSVLKKLKTEDEAA